MGKTKKFQKEETVWDLHRKDGVRTVGIDESIADGVTPDRSSSAGSWSHVLGWEKVSSVERSCRLGLKGSQAELKLMVGPVNPIE